MKSSVFFAGIARVSAAITIMFSTGSLAAINYSQDFETLGDSDPIGDGWLYWGGVYDGTGTNYPGVRKFGYGPGNAPNSTLSGYGEHFSAIAQGEPTAGSVGVKYLNVFSDYQCCLFTGDGHVDDNSDGNGVPDVVQSVVFQEFPIAAEDLDSVITFTFDAKRPNNSFSAGEGPNCLSNTFDFFGCTARAFIRTRSGSSVTSDVTLDTTSISKTSWNSYEITLSLTAATENQALQIGFENFSSEYGNTGVYYDNIVISQQVNHSIPLPIFAYAGLATLLALVGFAAIGKHQL